MRMLLFAAAGPIVLPQRGAQARAQERAQKRKEPPS